MEIKDEVAEKETDRISDLPDEILSHILTFLDTRTAVRTSVLSTRWKLIWTDCETLDFTYEPEASLEQQDSSDALAFALLVNKINFTVGLDDFLSRRTNARLTKFHLNLKSNVARQLVDYCLQCAARHNVEEVKLRAFCMAEPVELQKFLFTCQILTSLKLTNVVKNSIALPKCFEVPNLKMLKLSRFIFSIENFNGEIFTGCTNLESLVLKKCQIKASLKVLNISCESLKNLEILNWRSPMHGGKGSIYVDAPQLESFTFKGVLTKVRFMNHQLCLDTIEAPSAVDDLRKFVTSTFDNLQHLKCSVKDKCGEMVTPVHTVKHLLESSADEKIMLDLSEGLAHRNDHNSIVEGKDERERIVALPRHVISYLLELSLSAKSIVVEFGEVVHHVHVSLVFTYVGNFRETEKAKAESL